MIYFLIQIKEFSELRKKYEILELNFQKLEIENTKKIKKLKDYKKKSKNLEKKQKILQLIVLDQRNL